MKICPNCNVVNEDKNIYCSNCGYYFGNENNYENNQKSSNNAVVGLILGILSWVVPLFIIHLLALIFSIKGLKLSKNKNNSDHTMSLAGLILAIVAIVVKTAFFGIFIIYMVNYSYLYF